MNTRNLSFKQNLAIYIYLTIFVICINSCNRETQKIIEENQNEITLKITHVIWESDLKFKLNINISNLSDDHLVLAPLDHSSITPVVLTNGKQVEDVENSMISEGSYPINGIDLSPHSDHNFFIYGSWKDDKFEILGSSFIIASTKLVISLKYESSENLNKIIEGGDKFKGKVWNDIIQSNSLIIDKNL